MTDLELFEQWVTKYGGEIGGKSNERFWSPPAPLTEPVRQRRVLRHNYYWWFASRNKTSHDLFQKSERALEFAMLIQSKLKLPDGTVLTWERHKPTKWCCWLGPKVRVFNVPNLLLPYCVDWAFNGMPAEMLADKLLEILP